MGDYIIILPVYNDVATFKRYTYKFLTEHKLQDKGVLLIQSDKDAKDYGEAFPDIKQQRTPKGALQAVNFMSKKLPHNKKIVSIDDDVFDLKKLSGGKLVDVPDMNGLFNSIFDNLKKSKLSLAGFYPAPSAQYMSEREPITKDLRFIVGALRLYLNKKIPINLGGKSDYVFTIDNYRRDGGVLRYNHYGIRYQYKAGLEKAGDLEKFLKQYGDYVSKVNRHKAGLTSIILKKNP